MGDKIKMPSSKKFPGNKICTFNKQIILMKNPHAKPISNSLKYYDKRSSVDSQGELCNQTLIIHLIIKFIGVWSGGLDEQRERASGGRPLSVLTCFVHSTACWDMYRWLFWAVSSCADMFNIT